MPYFRMFLDFLIIQNKHSFCMIIEYYLKYQNCLIHPGVSQHIIWNIRIVWFTLEYPSILYRPPQCKNVPGRPRWYNMCLSFFIFNLRIVLLFIVYCILFLFCFLYCILVFSKCALLIICGMLWIVEVGLYMMCHTING